MSLKRTYAVIMAGGGGTRLWPLSRADRPKQSLPLLDGRTLFQMAVERLLPALPPERILVVTVQSQIQQLREQAPKLASANFLIEPSPKGTASVIGYAATVLSRKDPHAVMACLTADHLIKEPERFLQLLGAAETVALRGGLVTLGITPTYPATGYGYIHAGQAAGDESGFPVSWVLEFKEKPDRESAERFIQSGEYFWNSGMFVWTVGRILEEFQRLMPELASGLKRISAVLGTEGELETLRQVWAGLRNQTIDYAIMERAQGVSVIGADELGWSDLGDWARLSDILEPDSHGNLIVASDSMLVDTQDSLFYQERAPGSSRLIAALGLRDLILVDTPDVLLVCRRERAEEVRQLVAKLSEAGRREYL